jgi:Trk K+ transport system NAD-binding subunit
VIVEVIPDKSSVLASGVETALIGLDTRSEELLKLDGDVADVVVAAVKTEEVNLRRGEGKKGG